MRWFRAPKLLSWLRNRGAKIRARSSNLDAVSAFPAFAPDSDGSVQMLEGITRKTINAVFPSLRTTVDVLSGGQAGFIDQDDFLTERVDKDLEARIKHAFDAHGSDKSLHHSYQKIYSRLIDLEAADAVFEIGLGTHHSDVASHMGEQGQPGASLRAFRDLMPKAHIVGADVDRRILFQDERITTVFVDQTEPTTFEAIDLKGTKFDLMIDDGLHALDANVNALNFFIRHIKPDGYIVIEDIAASKIDAWIVISHIVSSLLDCWLIKTDLSFVFVGTPKATS